MSLVHIAAARSKLSDRLDPATARPARLSIVSLSREVDIFREHSAQREVVVSTVRVTVTPSRVRRSNVGVWAM